MRLWQKQSKVTLLNHNRPLLTLYRAPNWRAWAAVFLFGAAALSGGFVAATEKPKATTPPAKVAPAPTPALAPASTQVPDWPLGSERAQVTLIEYGSLTCSHCAAFNNEVLPSLKAKYVDTGRVRYVFRAFPTPPIGLAYPMHSLARCAGPQRYHRVVDAFFQQQSRIFEAAQKGRGAKEEVYAIFTAASGMTAAQADSCLQTQSHAEAVNRQSVSGEEMGVEGTPTLFVRTANGVTRLPPPYDAENVGRALDEALAALPPTPKAQPAKPKAKAKPKPKPKAKKP